MRPVFAPAFLGLYLMASPADAGEAERLETLADVCSADQSLAQDVLRFALRFAYEGCHCTGQPLGAEYGSVYRVGGFPPGH